VYVQPLSLHLACGFGLGFCMARISQLVTCAEHNMLAILVARTSPSARIGLHEFAKGWVKRCSLFWRRCGTTVSRTAHLKTGSNIAMLQRVLGT
jgi:hypothetical protein